MKAAIVALWAWLKKKTKEIVVRFGKMLENIISEPFKKGRHLWDHIWETISILFGSIKGQAVSIRKVVFGILGALLAVDVAVKVWKEGIITATLNIVKEVVYIVTIPIEKMAWPVTIMVGCLFVFLTIRVVWNNKAPKV